MQFFHKIHNGGFTIDQNNTSTLKYTKFNKHHKYIIYNKLLISILADNIKAEMIAITTRK